MKFIRPNFWVFHLTLDNLSHKAFSVTTYSYYAQDAWIQCELANVFLCAAKAEKRLVEPCYSILKSIHQGSPTMSTTATSTVPALPAEWKGDDSSPNFRAVGSLSPPVMRKIEPYGAAFLAHARRKRHGRTFSEDDRIQALSKVKKTEDSDDGEISEAEDPELLQRDAKDWKVGITSSLSTQILISYRRKIITLYLDFQNCATKLRMKTSRRLPERKSFVTIRIRRLPLDKPTAIVSSR